MAAAFQVPALKEYPVIPILQQDAMAKSRPYVAPAPIQQAIGYPGELVADWHDKAIGRMGGATYTRTTDRFDLERPKGMPRK